MPRFIVSGLAVVVALGSLSAMAAEKKEKVPAVLKFKMKSLAGKEVDLAR